MRTPSSQTEVLKLSHFHNAPQGLDSMLLIEILSLGFSHRFEVILDIKGGGEGEKYKEREGATYIYVPASKSPPPLLYVVIPDIPAALVNQAF